MIAKFMDFWRGQHPFVLLTENEVELVRSGVRTRTFSPGKAILQQGGDISSCLFLIAEGTAHLERDDLVGRVVDQN